MDRDDRHDREAEADTLAQIGQFLSIQNLAVRVRLPSSLVARAQAAWERDDGGDGTEETEQERRTRQEAGALALIGLTLREQAPSADGDDVYVTLDAWQIGSALDAAARRGLLPDTGQPSGDG